MQNNAYAPANRCHYCGATSYHHVVARDDTGALRATPRLLCTGCGKEFADVKHWREGQRDPAASATAG